jgi:hypothetical protein
MDSYEGYIGRLIGHLRGIAPTSFPRLGHSHQNRPSQRTRRTSSPVWNPIYVPTLD